MELKYSEPDKSTATLTRLQALQEQYDLDLDSQEVSEDDRQSSEQTDSEDDICLSDLSNTGNKYYISQASRQNLITTFC